MKYLYSLVLFLYLFISYCHWNNDSIKVCQNEDKTYNESCLQEMNYFSKFIKLQYPRVDTPIERSAYQGIKTLDEQLFDVFRDILPKIYTSSKEKEKTLKYLSSFFDNCAKLESEQYIKRVCKYFSSYYIWKEVKQSKITFFDIINVLEENREWIVRTIERSDFDEHYSPLDYWLWWITIASGGEIWIWDFLFWAAVIFSNKTKELKWNWILVLKSGDTHRQELARLTLNNSKDYYVDKRIWIHNHKLYYYIPIKMNEDDHYITSQYELQKDKSWKLSDCFHRENICPKNEECKPKEEKLSLSQCENLWIKLITTLWE